MGTGVRARVDIRVGAWRGKCEAALHVDEFIDFRQQLEAVYATLQGEARFESMGPWLELTVTVASVDRITVTGVARDDPGFGNTLTFTLSPMAQTDLVETLSHLRDIERELPLRGSPDD